MNRNEQIEQRLRAVEAPEAPASLGERLRAAIPEDLATLTASRTLPGARWWQLAAAMVLMIGGGWLAWTWTHDPNVPVSAPGHLAPSLTAEVPTAPPPPPRAHATSSPSEDSGASGGTGAGVQQRPLDSLASIAGVAAMTSPEQELRRENRAREPGCGRPRAGSRGRG